MNTRYYLGLDLGGTNIKAGIVDDRFTVICKLSRPTHADQGPDAVIDSMIETINVAVSEANLSLSDVVGIGIGSPGPLDPDRGVVKGAPNMPGWRDVPLRDRIMRATGRPTILENDANVAAFGEFWAGAGRGDNVRDMVMLTLGTGVGSGLIVDGRIVHGQTGMAGEGGHIIVQPGGRQCGCGQRGCLETYASASYTTRRFVEAVQTGGQSQLADRVKSGQPLDASDVFAAASQGDALACKIIDETAYYLGLACVSLCRLLDPQMIVFGGGMTVAGDALFSRIRRSFFANTWQVAKDQVRIVPAELGPDAGLVGAAAVARQADFVTAAKTTA